jgi:hypothetical protein
MAKFYVIVEIDTDTVKHAEEVVTERTGYDEDLGFDYTIQPLGMAIGIPSLVEYVNHLATGHGGN